MCFSPIIVKGQVCPCGQCFDCKMQKSNEWGYRCMLEAKTHKESCMLTLTYNEDNLPLGASLKREDLTKFLKRLRFSLGDVKIKYFACGEYGARYDRPHYHLIVFGWSPKDLILHGYDKKHNAIWRSASVEKLWKLGYSAVGDLTFESCRYCAKYLQKSRLDYIALGKEPPYTVMSKGLGLDGYDENWLATDKIYINGKYIKTPRYILSKMEEKYPQFVEQLKLKRKETARLMYESDPYFEKAREKKKRFFEKFRELLPFSKTWRQRKAEARYLEWSKQMRYENDCDWFARGDYESINNLYEYEKNLENYEKNS